ncbi:MAG: hypothetical protein CMA12_07875 [Euryarchaeota archaeon]|nr:hypothetical protein [Euryarchaeota archaeon]
MSIKSLIQTLILLLIILIMVVVYFKYFDAKMNIMEEINLSKKEEIDELKKLENKILNLEIKNQELLEKIDINKTTKENFNETKSNIKEIIKADTKEKFENDKKKSKKKINTDTKKQEKGNIIKNDTEIKNLVKNLEYTSVDNKGNKFYLLATSGKTNKNNNDVLDLENVKGKITSEVRDTIYIVSDFAQYNSINLNSKFYQNVIINYQDKKITCINFDINMEKNKAIAYKNVIITDPKSVMKAGIVEFDLKTKDIIINPESMTSEIEIVSN